MERTLLERLRAPPTNLSVAVASLERSVSHNSSSLYGSQNQQCRNGLTLGLRERPVAAHLQLARALYRRNRPGDRQRAQELFKRAKELANAASADPQTQENNEQPSRNVNWTRPEPHANGRTNRRTHRAECAEEVVDRRELERGLHHVPL